MITRIISAMIMFIVALTAIWVGSPYFEVLIFIVFLLAIVEWLRLTIGSLKGLERINYTIIGIIYLCFSSLLLIWMRNQGQEGMYFIIWFFCVIWGTDIGAYFVGKYFGGPKLAPQVSPNKTWSGFFGGITAAILLSSLFNEYFSLFVNLQQLIIASIVLSLIGQIGDLLESAFKRKLAIKDTGTLIPGHGGILDRIDSTLLGAPVGGIIVIILKIGEAG